MVSFTMWWSSGPHPSITFGSFTPSGRISMFLSKCTLFSVESSLLLTTPEDLAHLRHPTVFPHYFWLAQHFRIYKIIMVSSVVWAKTTWLASVLATFFLLCDFSLSLELLTPLIFTGFVFFVPINGVFHCLSQSLSPVALRVNPSDTLSGSPYTLPYDFSPWKHLSWILVLLALIWTSCSETSFEPPKLLLGFSFAFFPTLDSLFSWSTCFHFPCFGHLFCKKKTFLRKRGRGGNHFDILHLTRSLFCPHIGMIVWL